MKISTVAILGLTALLTLACGGSGATSASTATGGSSTGATPMDAWQRVLDGYARDGGLNYAGLAADRADLDAFLGYLEDARPAAWSIEEQLAFWSNAYNAVVAEFVLDLYPEIESVKDVGGFFDRQTRLVAGEQLTLDEIETRGRDLGDPRIHFAVVCASTSCPDLPAEAFEASRLDEQLEEATDRFLADPSKGLRYDADGNTLWLSSIFKWYAGDFTGGSTMVAFFARGKVGAWVVPRLPDDLRQTVLENEPSIRYLDYDWSLNDR